MSVFFVYSILATIVATFYLFKVLMPVVYSGRQRVPEAICMKYYITTGIVFFITCWVLAPFLAGPMFDRERLDKFKQSVYASLTSIE